MKIKQKNNQGVTLIALVITIIVLLILVGVTILTLTGDNGILFKTNMAREENNKKAATEIMNLKITNVQIESYTEKQEMPNLQYLANKLCDDKDMQYVELTTQKKKTAYTKETLLPLITIPLEGGSIFTKLHEYPYEFEIDSNLRLASIDGIQVAEKDNSITMTEEELTNKINVIVDAKVDEKVNAIVDAKVDEKVNAKISSYQKLRSDEYEEVPFIHNSIYTAPCDGYYCCSIANSDNTTRLL